MKNLNKTKNKIFYGNIHKTKLYSSLPILFNNITFITHEK